MVRSRTQTFGSRLWRQLAGQPPQVELRLCASALICKSEETVASDSGLEVEFKESVSSCQPKLSESQESLAADRLNSSDPEKDASGEIFGQVVFVKNPLSGLPLQPISPSQQPLQSLVQSSLFESAKPFAESPTLAAAQVALEQEISPDVSASESGKINKQQSNLMGQILEPFDCFSRT